MCDGDRAHACVSGLRRGSRNGNGVGLGGRAVLSGDSERPDIAFVRQSADGRLAVGALDVEAVRRDLRAGRNGDSVGVAFARNGNGACDRDGRDVRVVRLGLVAAAVFHGDGVGLLAVRLKFALVCDVHGGPARVRADDVDDAAVLNGDQRRARVFAAFGLRAEIGADLIVLVCRRRCDAQQSRALRHSQGVGGDIAAERGRQLACAGLERLEAGIRAVPAAAEILGSAGVHDADLIARMERAVRDRKVAEAEVGEPVVERAHPAGRWAAVKRLQFVNGGDVARTLFDRVLIAQRGEDAVHHGRIGLQLEPGVDQRAVPGSALRRRIRGVLHDHMGHAGQRQNADIRHVRAVFVIGVLHIGERQRIAAGFELPVDAVRLTAADAVDERFRAAVLRKRDGQLIAIRLRGNAVAELQNGGGAQRKGKRGRGVGLVLFLIAALKTLQLAVVDPGIAAGVRSADGGDGLLGIGDMTDAVVVPLLVGFAADAAGIGLIAGEDLLGAGHRRMALGGDGIGLRFRAAVSAARADDLARLRAGGRRPLAVFAAFRILAEVVAERRDIGRAVAFAALVAGVAGVALLGAQRSRDRALAIRFVEGHVLLPHERRIAVIADRGERVGQISVLQIVIAQRLGIRILPQCAQIIALGDLRGSGVDRAERRAARFAGGVAAGEGDFPLHSAAPVHIALDLACDAAGGRAGELAGVVAAFNVQRVAAAAENAACAAAGRGNVCGVVAAGDSVIVADRAAQNAADLAAAGDSAEVRAVLDHGVLIGVADQTADVVAGRGNDRVVEAVFEFRARTAGIADDRARIALAVDGAADGQIMDVGIRAELCKQAGCGVQAGDLTTRAVQLDLFAGADVQPCVFAEVDIGRQNAGNIRVLALCDEPGQLRAGADLVNAVDLRRLGLRRAVPCARCGCLQRDGEGVFALCRHGDAAGGIFNAGAGNGVEVFLGIGLERAVVRDQNGVARAVLQRDGQVLPVDGRAALILEDQRAGQERGDLHRDRDLWQTAENAGDCGRLKALFCTLGVCDVAVCRYVAKAAMLDRAGQRIGILRPVFRDGDGQLLLLRIAAEIINAELAAGLAREVRAVCTFQVDEEVVVVHTGKLFLRADQIGELNCDGIARLDGGLGLVRQLLAVLVYKLVAHAAGRHDLIGRKAGFGLRDLDDMAAGGQTADGHSAVLGSCNAVRREAAGICHPRGRDSGTQDSNRAAVLGLEAEACTFGAGVEQNVVLRVELPRLVLCDGRVHAVQLHVGLDGAAVRTDIHDKHARQLRPDGGEAVRFCAGLAVHVRHRVIRDKDDGRASLFGFHHGDVAVQRVRRDGHNAAGSAVHIDDLIVHLRQCDLSVVKVLDREPVAEGVELKRLADGHVLVALGVDVQVDARTVIDVIFKMIDRVLAEIAGQTEICLCDRVSRVVAQLDIVPIGRALRMADTVEVIRVLVKSERRRDDLFGRLSGRILGHLRDRLHEAEHIILRERTGVDG